MAKTAAMQAAAKRCRKSKGRAVSLADVRRAFTPQERREMGDKARGALAKLRRADSRTVDCGLPEGTGTNYIITCSEEALCDFLHRLGESDIDTAGAQGPTTDAGDGSTSSSSLPPSATVDSPAPVVPAPAVSSSTDTLASNPAPPSGGGVACEGHCVDNSPEATRARNTAASESRGALDTARRAITSPSLAAFSQTLRPYQEDIVAESLAHIARANALPDDAEDAKRRILFGCPTGTGKGSVELELLRRLRAKGVNAWIFTPNLEVVRGFLERCGCPTEDIPHNFDKMEEYAARIFVATTCRAQNRILHGVRGVADVVIVDEAHHFTLQNSQSGTHFALAPLAAWIGFTATPYRGSPKGTLELDAAWPDQVEVLTIPEAVAAGWWALPRFEVVGLVDDDKVRMSGGEFLKSAAGNAVAARQDDLAALVSDTAQVHCANCAGAGDYYSDNVPYKCDPCNGSGTVGDIPTAVVVPSRDAAGAMVEALDRVGVSATMVIGTTKAKDRAAAYARCKACEDVLVVVEVLAEGVDLPWLRRMFDCSPTMSPVRWLQRIGRVTRPGDVRPEVIVCCRNLERHAYLLGGLIPRRVIAKAQEEFEKPSKRGGMRSIGFEALRRFKAIDLPLLDGVRGTGYMLYSASEAGEVTEWAMLLDPTGDRTVVARRVSHKLDTTHEATVGDGMKVQVRDTDWGKWQRVEACPPDLAGFATSKQRGKPSAGQQKWWDNQARRFGLDPDADITRRQFAALPVLSQIGCGMHPTQHIGEE